MRPLSNGHCEIESTAGKPARAYIIEATDDGQMYPIKESQLRKLM